MTSAARASGTVTLEAWVTPADLTQSGPARIATVSSGTSVGQVDIHLGQSATSGSARLRTTVERLSWIQPSGVFGSTSAATHVVTTFDGTTQRFYVDGAAHPLTATPGGTLANWDTSYPLVVGNEAGLNRSWLGTVYLVAAYSRALSAAEVQQNFAAGPSG